MVITINMNNLKIISKKKKDNYLTYAIEPNFPLPNEMRIGIDPGTTNLGIAVIKPKIESVTLYKITLKRHKKALLRLLDVQQVLGDTIGHFTPNSKAIIEGASYGDRFRQVEMAEQRAAMLLWFHKFGIDVDMIPPLTIRKQVFGSGKIKNPYPEIDNNMIAALSCALYESQ